MRFAKDIWDDYLDIIEQMTALRNISGVTMYGLDDKRSKLHAELNEYYRNNIRDYNGGFNESNFKLYTDNLDLLIEYIDRYSWSGGIADKIERYFSYTSTKCFISGETKDRNDLLKKLQIQ